MPLKKVDELKQFITVVYISRSPQYLPSPNERSKSWEAIVALTIPFQMVLLTINIILDDFFNVHIPIVLLLVLIGGTTIVPALMINHIVSQNDNVQKAWNYILEIDKADREEKVFFIGAIYFITPIIPLLLVVVLSIWLK
ncbi:hypothetical protein VAS14_11579 [Photobacterium angustum S14]|uniref:Uncharacterized protein n=1 Tax=Photobacterium angustum (strain S14 / CCUG 15956) TaxID=314292 RepID=Q1ZVV9_PHOAS|nr:hypothetical protein VAS14_11579 [Photobacterium angustum S14]